MSFEVINISLLEEQEQQISDKSYSEDDLYDVPIIMIVILSCCYGVVSLTTVVGNFCVLLIVAVSRRMQTVTNFFIANLAIADIVIGLFSIPFQFQAALLQKWVLPAFMCAFCPFVQVLSVNVSVFSLTAIALDRYRAVMFPLKAKTSKFSAKWIIVFIWIFSALAGVPYAFALRVTMVFDPETGNFTKPFCQNVGIPVNIWKVYNHILVGLQYFVPLCLITMVYINIGLKLKDTQTPGNKEGVRDDAILRNRKKVIHMLYIVVTLFSLCWLPLQTYNILQEIIPEINKHGSYLSGPMLVNTLDILDVTSPWAIWAISFAGSVTYYKYINIIWFCCHWLAMSNSCYNPFIYAIYNERFNAEFKNRFGCCLILFRFQNRENKTLDSLSSRYA